MCCQWMTSECGTDSGERTGCRRCRSRRNCWPMENDGDRIARRRRGIFGARQTTRWPRESSVLLRNQRNLCCPSRRAHRRSLRRLLVLIQELSNVVDAHGAHGASLVAEGLPTILGGDTRRGVEAV